MALANVTLTNTFDEWRVRTNQIIYKQDELEGNVANVMAYANTAFLPKLGGTVTGNVAFTGMFANVSSNTNLTGFTNLTGTTNVTGNLTVSGPVFNLRSNVFTYGADNIVIDLLG